MSDAADKLTQTRLAIIAHVQGREHRGDRGEDRDERAPGGTDRGSGHERRPAGVGSWFASLRRAAGTWWRHHPAHAGMELATPLLSDYAARKPLQYLGIAALIGAGLAVARPWRLISVTGLLVALVKSSQLSSVVLSAISATDYGKDRRPPA